MTSLRSRLRVLVVLLLTTLLGVNHAAVAHATPLLPDRPDSYVVNLDEAISQDEQKQIEDYLKGVNEAHEENVYVYTTRTLDGQTLGDVAADLSLKWELEPTDVLVMASTEDGAVRVHVGAQSRAKIGDEMARQIAQEMLNSMTSGQTQVAIMSAITSIFYELEGVDPTAAVDDHDHDHDAASPSDTSADGMDGGNIALMILMVAAGFALAFGLGVTYTRRRDAAATPTEGESAASAAKEPTDS